MAPPSRTNLTGFDIRKLAAASSPSSLKSLKDPWHRMEEWRYTGPFTRWNRFKGAFPGLGIATVAFTFYCGFEYFFLKDKHHDEGHGAEGHH
ncbi:MAG: hypothetical protein Q9192_007030 [Flavoplaca navasiana]